MHTSIVFPVSVFVRQSKNADLILATITSLLNLSRPLQEIVLLRDQRFFESLAIVEKFTAIYPFISVLDVQTESQQLWPAVASYCSGQFVMVCDPGVTFSEETLVNALDLFSTSPTAVIATPYADFRTSKSSETSFANFTIETRYQPLLPRFMQVLWLDPYAFSLRGLVRKTALLTAINGRGEISEPNLFLTLNCIGHVATVGGKIIYSRHPHHFSQSALGALRNLSWNQLTDIIDRFFLVTDDQFQARIGCLQFLMTRRKYTTRAIALSPSGSES